MGGCEVALFEVRRLRDICPFAVAASFGPDSDIARPGHGRERCGRARGDGVGHRRALPGSPGPPRAPATGDVHVFRPGSGRLHGPDVRTGLGLRQPANDLARAGSANVDLEFNVSPKNRK